MSLVSSLNIATQALAVNQAAITVISNNISNVDTDGYSKLRANLASSVNVSRINGESAIGAAESLSGVKLQSIKRYSDSYLQNYYWQENANNSYLERYSNIASNIEDMVNELNDTGLSDALTSFYEAADTLNDNPSDITARTNYVSSAENLCSVFNQTSAKLANLQESLVGTAADTQSSEIASEVDDVNSLLDQLADVNSSIVKTSSGGASSSSLLDKRDLLISQLTEYSNFDIKENANGTVAVSIGDYELIDGPAIQGHLSASNSLDVDNNIITTINVVDPDSPTTVIGDVTNDVTGGSIGAILDVCGINDNVNFTIHSVSDALNSMAADFATVMNDIQTHTNYPSGTSTPMCMTADGSALQVSAATNYFFVNKDTPLTPVTGITAANISVRSAIVTDPYLVAAARVADPAAAGATTQIGNNSNMTLILDARTDNSYYEGMDLEGTTVEGYLANMVSNVGIKTDRINSNYETQNLVLNEIDSKLKSETGVNLDEELADLIKYQRAYEAAARVFSITNSLLEEMVNLGR